MKEHSGKFLLFGGGPAIRTSGQPFLADFVAKAGGPHVQITILTAGSDEAAEINGIYWQLFAELGVTNLVAPRVDTREDANVDWVVQKVAESDALFVAGGAQSKLIEKLAGTAMERAIRDIHAKGGLLGGTSSGASVFGHPLILDGGTLDSHLRKGMVEYCGGFEMIGGNSVVDTHCSSRGRFPRLISLLIEHPWAQVIGIDEDTALFIDPDGIASASGNNTVYIFDALTANTNPVHFCGSNFQLHCLKAGDRYNLVTRQKLTP
jgi:cyanophycinase